MKRKRTIMTIDRHAPRGRSAATQAVLPSVALSILMLFGILGVIFAFATAGGWVASSNIEGWYAGIQKPALTPENWVFPIVWNFLYFLIGLACWLAWRAAGGINEAGAELALFVAQLMFNIGWVVIFFGLHRPGLAAVEVLILDASIAVTAAAFWRLSKPAALLMLPYLAWTLFATYLTIGVWLLNR
jgi:tryptophan-rich sensory protein